MHETKRLKIEHAAIGVLTLIIIILIAYFALLARRNSFIVQEINDGQEFIHELLLTNEVLKAETQNLLWEMEELQAEMAGLQAEEPIDPMHYRVIQQILAVAPEMLRQVFDEEVELNPPEDFIMLPNNHIMVSGQWFCTYNEMPITLYAIFGYWLWQDEIRLDLLSYSPFWIGYWRSPWESPNNHSWVRYHALETVPVRFYWMGGDGDEFGYNVEYLDGETFPEQLAYYALKHLNRRIVDAWFVGTILYVNLHHSEPMRMSSGTFGEWAMYTTLVSSLSSVPSIDALVIMVDGHRESTFGGHGMPFQDIYLIP